MCLPLLGSYGRRSYKNSRKDTHDIFIERRPGMKRRDDIYRRQRAGLPPAKQMPVREHVAIVVRRKTVVDDEHEARQLGSRYWSQRLPGQQWDIYHRTKNGIEMHGGRLYKLSDKERKAAAWQQSDDGETNAAGGHAGHGGHDGFPGHGPFPGPGGPFPHGGHAGHAGHDEHGEFDEEDEDEEDGADDEDEDDEDEDGEADHQMPQHPGAQHNGAPPHH